MSLGRSIKENIDELVHEATDTMRGKKHKILNEYFICNYFSANIEKNKDFIEDFIRYLLEK